VTSGAYVTKRYAASYAITIGALSKTISDDGVSEIISFTIGPLTTGSYTLSITPVSDTGITGTATTQSISIGGAPLPPGVPTYFSGDITATIIHFTASATAGATYRAYMPQEVGGPTFVETAAATHIAGTGTLSITLPSRAATGDMTIFITSVSGGIESTYQKVTISYAADGSIASSPPNIPTLLFQATPVSGGRNINVTYAYDSTAQLAAPTKIQTRITKYETGTITTQTEATIGSMIGHTIRANLTIGSGSDGWFTVQARTKSAGGSYSDWSTAIGPVWCSTEVIGGITGLVTNIVG